MAIWKGNNPILRGRKRWPWLLSTCEFWDDPSKQQITARCQETLMFERWLEGRFGWVFFIWKESSTCTWFWLNERSNPTPQGSIHWETNALGNLMLFFSVRNCWWLPPFSQGWRFWRPLNFSLEGEAHVVLALQKLSLGFGWPFQSHNENLGYMNTENQYEEIDI